MAYEHPITIDRIDNGFVVRWYEGPKMDSHKKFVPDPLAVAELLTDLFPEYELQEPIVGDGFEGDAAGRIAEAPKHAVPFFDHLET
jgi:hypothetical protein